MDAPNRYRIAVIGLGYVGLPLARLFSGKYPVIGFDTDPKRIEELSEGIDVTRMQGAESLSEVLIDAIPESRGLYVTSCPDDIRECDFYVIAVPTPADRNNHPDLTPLIRASETVGSVVSKGDIVVYESTVYPGMTEEECIPVIERTSGLQYNVDFFAGYSPERINPGDKEHTVEKIRKVTSGSTPEIARRIDALYNSVLLNGTHLAPSIRVAEASKIVENCQRDVNIAFFNELSKMFQAMGIDTGDVIEAAASKWNFIRLKPGLVGGHCIGVDPYYLIEKSKVNGYSPDILIRAREVNDSMGEYAADQLIRLMAKKGLVIKDAAILILGFTFKENCPDIRNTKAADICRVLEEYTSDITICDPWADACEVKREYGYDIRNEMPTGKYDAVLLAVAHDRFLESDIRGLRKPLSVVYDIKGVLDRTEVDGRL